MAFRTLDGVDVAGRRVLLRADLNVPVRDGRITDLSRVERLSPTIRELSGKGAKVIVCSHFDRPKGKRVPSMSLEPLAGALGEVLGRRVRFAEDCVGVAAQQSIDRMANGDVLLLENTRYHAAEEQNDDAFARCLAGLAEIFVNDAFSTAQAELEALDAALGNPVRPVMAIVGGSKVSTKIELLGNLCTRVDVLVIGGAMANTFLAAEGIGVGKSLQEAEMHATAREITVQAKAAGCEILLPVDAVTATEFRPDPPTLTVPIAAIPADAMMLDVGPATVAAIVARLAAMKTLVWNGPLGAFETRPFDAGTNALAEAVAAATGAGRLRSVAGGGDTVSALRQAGVADRMSYLSTAGGAFLEWLEGKTLPAVAALSAA
jgi:phosphoglycerate kinase